MNVLTFLAMLWERGLRGMAEVCALLSAFSNVIACRLFTNRLKMAQIRSSKIYGHSSLLGKPPSRSVSIYICVHVSLGTLVLTSKDRFVCKS